MNLEDLDQLDAADAEVVLNAVKAAGCWPPIAGYSETTCPLALALAQGTGQRTAVHVRGDTVVVTFTEGIGEPAISEGIAWKGAPFGAVYEFVTWVDLAPPMSDYVR